MVSLCARAVAHVARRAPRSRRGERARDAAEHPRRRRDARPGRTAASASASASASDAEEDTAEEEASRVERETRVWLETIVMGLNLCPFARAALPGTTVQVTRAETLEALRLEVRDALFALRDASEAEAATTLIVLSPRSVRFLGAATFEGFMEGARVVADEEARRLTESLPKKTRAALDLAGDLIEIVPFHPAATFGAAPSAEDEVGSGGYICTYLDTGLPKENDEGDDGASPIPDEAALRAMIAEHAAMRGGADTRADWIQSKTNAKPDDDRDDDEHDFDFFTENTTDAVDPADYTGRSPHPVLHLLRQSDVDAADESWFERGPGDDIRAKNAALLRGMGESKMRAALMKCFEKRLEKRDET
jgi:hypothetical protein